MNPLEGEIWQVALDPTIGDEIEKMRPCVVVNGSVLTNLGVRVVVPLTGWKADKMSRRPWFVEIEPDSGNGLEKPSAATCHHIRSVSTERFVRLVGRISAEDLEDIRAGIKITLNQR